MNEMQRQALSALRDGELGRAEANRLLDTLTRDPELDAAWEHYHLIGQALRGERINPAGRGIAAALDRTLNAESAGSRRFRSGPRTVGLTLAAAAVLGGVAVIHWLPGSGPGRLPLSLSNRSSAPAAQSRWQLELEQSELAARLDQLLLTHREYLPIGGAPGMFHDALLVRYEPTP